MWTESCVTFRAACLSSGWKDRCYEASTMDWFVVGRVAAELSVSKEKEHAMNITYTPILANGMVMFEVYFYWAIALLITGGVALVAIILAWIHRTRKPTRWLPVASLVGGFAPAGVLLWFHKPVASYAMRDLPVVLFISVLPIVMSALALWLSRRAVVEKQPQDAEVSNECL